MENNTAHNRKPVDVITHVEYEHKRTHGYAGPVSAMADPHKMRTLWSAAWPDWDGTYWHMSYGPALGPVNVRA
ncbi:hypothetical protein [Nocardia transvalensis]|uniref:hypothetical protein n=1 Tax=Nocardia transvalensis TaxID=37333 RepID=UPI001894794E|nr:hypothetical protein [Nocardia transvalensis]MBF6332463.1 hypothetical protein [Nocardia transvalensis]